MTFAFLLVFGCQGFIKLIEKPVLALEINRFGRVEFSVKSPTLAKNVLIGRDRRRIDTQLGDRVAGLPLIFELVEILGRFFSQLSPLLLTANDSAFYGLIIDRF